MKRLVRFRLPLTLARLLVLVPLCAPPSSAQVVRAASPPASPAVSPADSFTSLDGRFTIALPARVSAFRSVPSDTPAGRVEERSLSWATAFGTFGVAYFDHRGQASDNKAMLDAVRARVAAQAAKGEGSVKSEREISLGALQGREIRVELPEGVVLVRAYAEGQRVFRLTAFVAKDKQAQEKDAVKVLDSFKVLSAAELPSLRQRKIKEATPASLPQKPIARKLKSDAADEELKGKVKMVVTESEDLSGAQRKLVSIVHYDEAGNLTRRESYDYRGNPSDVRVYGYIDGQRVSNQNSIDYEYNPPAPANNSETTSESRYTTRYQYKYDDKGNLAEWLTYGSDGMLRTRVVYTYKDNQKELLYYTADDKPYRKEITTLDQKGNATELSIYNPRTTFTESKQKYAYEFDAKGNWIKQIVQRQDFKRGDKDFKLSHVIHRKITYY